jgi:FkbM family methyltransferase
MKILMKIKSYGLPLLMLSIFRVLLVLALKVSGKNFVIRRIFNYKMHLDLYDNGLSKQLIKYRKRELDHKYILDQVLKPGSNVLDIGANIGYYALMEHNLIGAKGRLIAIEPSPTNVILLKKNIELNNRGNNTRVISGAISSKTGSEKFFLSHASNLNTFHNYGTVSQHLSGESIDVQTYRVKDALTEDELKNGLDLIRMDVEGHEVDVLNGMIKEIKNGELTPSIIFETHISRYTQENDMSLTLSDLFELGYRVKYMASSWQKGTKIIQQYGYQPIKYIKTDGVIRGIFLNINNEHAIDIICNSGGARTVYLEFQRS